MTPDLIQKLSVEAVSKFLTKEASLSEAIAEQAIANELNAEQTKRVIEASNSIAYLRQLEKSASDRTFEFPVASYEEVLRNMVIPEASASKNPSEANSIDQVSVVEKQASESGHGLGVDGFDSQFSTTLLSNEVIRAKAVLEKMAYDKEALRQDLLEKAASFAKEKNALEKLSMVISEEDFPSMLVLTGLEKSASQTSVLFNESELSSAKKVYDLYKKAQELVSEEEQLQTFIQRAEPLCKEANLVGALVSGATRVATAPFKVVGKTLASGVKNQYAIRQSTKQMSKTFSPEIKSAIKAGDTTARKETLKAFDSHAATVGQRAAEAKFGFKTPGAIARMSGGTKLAIGTSVLAAPTYEHKSDVWETLHPKTPKI